MLDRPHLFPSRPIIGLDQGTGKEWKAASLYVSGPAPHIRRGLVRLAVGEHCFRVSQQESGCFVGSAKKSRVAFGVYSPLRECPGAPTASR
jgi:hypothetical protein